MADIDEVKRLKALCEKYELEGREILSKYTDDELAAIFNGIGPDAFPQWLRSALDALHPSLAPVAFIHDVEWHESENAPEMSVANRRVAAQIATQSSARAKRSGHKAPRTETAFAESNARFRRNGCKVASAAFGWWRPRRYLVMWDAVKFARICQRFGWSAWLAPSKAQEKVGAA